MGDEYDVLVAEDVREFIAARDEKTKRILKDNLSKLEQPYPGRGKGDKEQITWRGMSVYRLHIGRSWTAFYEIEDDENAVKVREVLPIDEAHDEYGELD
jgi:mRNA-degrading endonuclease RelE of RelBE toxin-antitoxin system